MGVENPHSVGLKFRSVGSDDVFELLSDELQVSTDIASAFAPIFEAIAPSLHLVLLSQDKGVPRVQSPVRRRWQGLKLVEDRIANDGDTLTVQWETNRNWETTWDRRKPREQIAKAHRGVESDFGPHCVARLQDAPALDLTDLVLTFQEGPTPQWLIAGRVRFLHCPPLRCEAEVAVSGKAEQRVTIETDGNVRIVMPVPHEWPEIVHLKLTSKKTEPVVSGSVDLRVPTRLKNFELATEDGRFMDVLLVEDVPARARFSNDGYVPGTITLRFEPQHGDAAPTIVRATKIGVVDDTVEYRLPLSEPVAFPNGVPGSMFIYVEHQEPPDPVATIKLVPRLIRGHWEKRLEGNVFSVASLELDLSAVVEFAAPFDLIRDQRNPPDPSPLRGGSIAAPTRPIIASRVVLTRGAAIPIDDRCFTPAYPLNPIDLWKPTPLDLGPRGQPRRSRISNTDSRTKDLFVRKANAVRGDPDVLELGENTFALVAVHVDAKRKFAAPIVDPTVFGQSADSTQSFGIFFRGFCLSARLRSVRDSVCPGGLMLILDKPLPIDGTVKPPVSAFLPIRAAASPTRNQYAFWNAPHEPVFVDVLDGIPEHESIGYVYKGPEGADDLFWARYPEDQSTLPPLYYTFEDHLIDVTPKGILFRGWWLPGGSSRTFPGTADGRAKAGGFAPYSFRFARGAMDPFLYHIGADIEVTGQGTWLTAEEQQEVKKTILELHDRSSSSRESLSTATGTAYSLVFRQRDRDGVYVTASPVVDSHEVGLYSLI